MILIFNSNFPGLAQLTSRRSPDHLVTIFLPDFYREDCKRFLSLFYRGEVIIENEVQSSILKELFKTLQIESVKLSDLALSEVERKVVKEPPPPPKIGKILISRNFSLKEIREIDFT